MTSYVDDNAFPKVILVEGTAPTSAASGQQKLFLDSADHKLKRKDSGGTVTTIEGGGGGSLEVTDGTTDLTSVTKITTTMLKVGGTAGASTLIPNLSTASATLASDVTLTTSGTWYDVLSVSLAAGTWLLLATCQQTNGTANTDVSSRLYDGTNTLNHAYVNIASGPGYPGTTNNIALVTPTGTTTYKLQCTQGRNSGTAKAASLAASTGNTVTALVAVRIA